MDKNVRKTDKNRAKKTIIIVLAAMTSVILILALSVLLIDLYEKRADAKKGGEVDFEFYEANYDEDIFENEIYAEKYDNGNFIRYTENDVTLTFNREQAKEHSEELGLIVDMLYAAIYGDHNAYNSKFSETYYESNAPKDRFTMQMICDVKITHQNTEEITTEQEKYTKAVYYVEYRIYRNNGTFRNDVTDKISTQVLVMTDRTGEWCIDSLVKFQTNN